MKIILWADEPDHAVPVRNKLREDGHVGMIRDARMFHGLADAERCDAIAFIAASKRDLIVAAYASEHCVERWGQVQIYDVETGDFGEPIAPLAVAPEPKAPTQADIETDMLSQRLDNLSDADLRTYARGVTGAEIAADATREDIEALLRQAQPGEGKLNARGVEPAPEPAPAAAAPAPAAEAPPVEETPTETEAPASEAAAAAETAPEPEAPAKTRSKRGKA